MKTRRYDKEFKLNAISLYKSGKKAKVICKDLGIPEATFAGWLREYKQSGDTSFPGSGNIKDSNQELYKLKKELEDTRLERDILKKALAIFSRQK
jgi:transposase-like protein